MLAGTRLYGYQFSSGKTAPIADFADYVAWRNIPPDGKQTVFMRSAELANRVPELWIMERDNNQLTVPGEKWYLVGLVLVQIAVPELELGDPARAELYLPAL